MLESARKAERRLNLLNRLWPESSDNSSSHALRREHQDEWDRCAGDVLYFVESYCYTYDPRRIESPHIPFKLFDYQKEYLLWLDGRLNGQENGLVEKSRDMGATWLNCVFDLHHWLFVPGYKAGIGSRKLELVDRLGDMDAILPKIRYMLYRLPEWMMPKGFDRKRNDNYCRLYNPEMDSSITGEGGDDIGRGGRNTRYTIDEHASIQHADLVEMAVSQNTNCVIYVSTPRGSGNLFARKRFEGKIKVFTMHWEQHPHKDQAWYDDQCSKYDPVTVAQEVDIDYAASVEGICIPAKWVRAAVGLDLTTEGAKIAGLDVGETNDLNVYTKRHGVVVQKIEGWGGMNTTQTSWKARDMAQADGVEMLKYDRIGIGAGVSGTLGSADEPLGFEIQGIDWGNPAGKRTFWDAEEKFNHERFLNQRMEDWWHLRIRFEATWEHVNGIKEHPLERLISIPNHPQLIAELSQPLVKYTETGKLKLESKKDMKQRGVKSPNYADSLALCFSTQEVMFMAFV